ELLNCLHPVDLDEASFQTMLTAHQGVDHIYGILLIGALHYLAERKPRLADKPTLISSLDLVIAHEFSPLLCQEIQCILNAAQFRAGGLVSCEVAKTVRQQT